MVGGALGYIQWRASHHQGPDLASILARNGATVDPSGPVMPDKTTKAAASTASNTNADAANAKNNAAADGKNSGGSSARNEDEDSSVIDANAAAEKNANAVAANNDSKSGSAKPDNKGNAQSQDDSDEADTASNTKSVAAKTSDEDEKAAQPESDGPVTKTAKAAHKSEVADEAPAKPKTLGDKDPLLIQADKYIQGRGVRKNCSTGVNLLRQAVSEGNPAASIKFGALYWSGTCVTQSKVTAYEWFSRAHSLEPKNRWVERSRNSLWASMTPAEQRRVSY
jgi:TPR repeat protein